MQTTWLQRRGHRECILFFSGWGMDTTPFLGLPAAHHDVCLLADYRELSLVNLDDFAAYNQLHLIAWSMGVWVAAHLLASQVGLFTSATAIGGTLTPVDDQRGIPPDSYAAMLDHFNEAVLTTFYRNMFDEEVHLARFLDQRPQRDLAGLGDEMAAFRDASLGFGPSPDIYTRKIVTSRDRIFSGRNQIRAWGKGCATVTNWPHFPFYYLADWQELLFHS